MRAAVLFFAIITLIPTTGHCGADDGFAAALREESTQIREMLKSTAVFCRDNFSVTVKRKPDECVSRLSTAELIVGDRSKKYIKEVRSKYFMYFTVLLEDELNYKLGNSQNSAAIQKATSEAAMAFMQFVQAVDDAGKLNGSARSTKKLKNQ